MEELILGFSVQVSGVSLVDREILHQARYWLLVPGFSFRLVPKLRLGNTYGTEAPASS